MQSKFGSLEQTRVSWVFLWTLIAYGKPLTLMVLTITCTLGVALTVPSLGLNSLNFHKVELSTTTVIPPLTYSHILNKYNSRRGSEFTSPYILHYINCDENFELFSPKIIRLTSNKAKWEGWRSHSLQSAFRHFEFKSRVRRTQSLRHILKMVKFLNENKMSILTK